MRRRRWTQTFRHVFAVMILAVGVGTGTAAHADVPDDSDWYARLAPYFWAASLNGDVTVGERTADVNVSFGDVFSNLDFAALAAFEVGKGDWSVLADVNYLDLSKDATLPAAPGATATVDFQEWLVSAALNWRLYASHWASFKVFVGGRYVNFGTDLTLRLPEQTLTPSASQAWFDPLLGARGRAYLPANLFIPYYIDIGGFQIGSDVSSNGLVGLGYDFGWLSLVLDYRYLYMNYDDDNFAYDAVEHGLLLGVIFEL